ncbi:MAG TPA: hypothetical protein VGJ18_21490 [Gemmatimonadaceae bacterium]|jgi:hypothetical protein
MTDPKTSTDSMSVAAVLAKRSREDLGEMLEELIALFVGVMPDVDVKRSLFGRTIKSVRIPLSDRAFVLERTRGGSFEARRQQIVRGVAIRNDPLEIDTFIAELSVAIDAELRRSERGRSALDSWLRSNL